MSPIKFAIQPRLRTKYFVSGWTLSIKNKWFTPSFAKSLELFYTERNRPQLERLLEIFFHSVIIHEEERLKQA
jgi:hypothetical protein